MKKEVWEHKGSHQTKILIHYSNLGRLCSEPEQKKFIDFLQENCISIPEFDFMIDGSVMISSYNVSFLKTSDFWIDCVDGVPHIMDSNEVLKNYLEVGDVVATEHKPFKFDRSELSVIEPKELDLLETLINKVDYNEINAETISKAIRLANEIEDVLYGTIDETYHVEVTRKVLAQMPQIPFLSDDKALEMIYDAIKGFDWKECSNELKMEVYKYLLSAKEQSKEEGELWDQEFCEPEEIYKIKVFYHHYESGPIVYIMKVISDYVACPY